MWIGVIVKIYLHLRSLLVFAKHNQDLCYSTDILLFYNIYLYVFFFSLIFLTINIAVFMYSLKQKRMSVSQAVPWIFIAFYLKTLLDQKALIWEQSDPVTSFSFSRGRNSHCISKKKQPKNLII